jgi:hypothetical protein
VITGWFLGPLVTGRVIEYLCGWVGLKMSGRGVRLGRLVARGIQWDGTIRNNVVPPTDNKAMYVLG